MPEIVAINSICEGTTVQWNACSIVLPKGMMAHATDTNMMKKGDGVHTWTELPVWFNITDVNAAIDYIANMPTPSSANAGELLLVNSAGNGITTIPAYLVPTGGTIIWWTDTPPDGYLELDGSWLSKTTYANLYAKIGDRYGSTDTLFRLPDTRGFFLRGWAHGSINDPDSSTRTDRGDGTTGDNIGTIQIDEFESHNHELICNVNAYVNSNTNHTYNCWNSNWYGTDTTADTGGAETRPLNINAMFCIKY